MCRGLTILLLGLISRPKYTAHSPRSSQLLFSGAEADVDLITDRDLSPGHAIPRTRDPLLDQ